MRRLFTVALLGIAVAAAATDASAQGRQGGRGPRGGVMDTARARRMDSLRVARGDTGFRRRGPDSLGRRGPDSLRERGPGRGGPMGGRGALMGIQLNDNEKAAVKTITEKYRGELQQLREANRGAQRGQNAQLATQAQAIMEREQAEIRAALTAEHQAQFDANVTKRKEIAAKGGGRRGQRPPAQADR